MRQPQAIEQGTEPQQCIDLVVFVEPGQSSRTLSCSGATRVMLSRSMKIWIPWTTTLGEREEVPCMPLPRVVQLAGQRQLLEAELPHGLQHLVARLIIDARHLAAAGSARPVPRRRRGPERPPSGAATASAASRVKPPGKDREPAKERLLVGGKQVVAPGDRVAHRALPGRQIPSATRQQGQAPFQASQERSRRQHFDPRRGQLDGEGQAIQPPADGGDGCRVVRGEGEGRLDRCCPLDEERHRRDLRQFCDRWQPVCRGQWQGEQREHPLSPHTERLATGGQDGEAGTGGKERDDVGCGGEHPLAVVEDEQQPLGREEGGQRLRGAAVRRISRTPRAAAIVGTTRSGSVSGERSTKTTPSGKSSTIPTATAMASRVLPDPPGPVRVTSRTSSLRKEGAERRDFRLAPDQAGQRDRHRAGGGLAGPRAAPGHTAGRAAARSAARSSVAERERVGQQPHGLQPGRLPQVALQVADAAHAETGALGQLLLGEGGGGAQAAEEVAE